MRKLHARALETAALLACLAGGFGALAAACGQDASLVGGTCAAGYAQCGNECVDLSTDPGNCGSCGHSCPSGVACVAGSCGGLVDGATDAPGDGARDSSADGASDSALDGALDSVGPDGDAAPPDGFNLDGPGKDGAAEGSADGPPTDAPFDTSPLCDPDSGLTDCMGMCVDEQNDPMNCGMCGRVCASNLCVGGMCQGVTAGNVVVIGHDYFVAQTTSAQARVLSNSVLLPSSNPLRILSFEHYANATAVTKAKAAIAAGAAAQGRTLSVTVSNNDNDIPNMLTIQNDDVLLVYDQANAAPGTLGPLGASWAPTLSTFLGAGGVVVVLDGAEGQSSTGGEMPLFETSAGLLNVSAHTRIPPGTPVDVVAPGDAVAVGVLSPYGVTKDSVHYTAEPPSSVVTYVVVEPVSGEPVVVHKVVP